MNKKHIDHRGHREHGEELNGTLAPSPFFPHQSRPAEIIPALPRNLICYAQLRLGAVQILRPHLSLKPNMTPVSTISFLLCALCVLCGQSLLPLA